MSDHDGNLADGEARDAGEVLQALTKSAWLFRWERRLTVVTTALILLFYLALLGFVFLGNFRLSVGSGYFFTSFRPHTTGDIPIIVALSTIPTLLLIALLRYFHFRPKQAAEDNQTSLPLSIEAARELIKATSDAMKASESR